MGKAKAVAKKKVVDSEVERRNDIILQLQNRVTNLDRQLEEKEAVHLTALALAKNEHRETVLSEVARLMETELSCSICNEVYIEPAVLRCGHTYCSYCINRALQSDVHCPICRTTNNFHPPAKNVEIRNFTNKIYEMLPQEVRTARAVVLQEREEAVLPPIPNRYIPNQPGRISSRSFVVQQRTRFNSSTNTAAGGNVSDSGHLPSVSVPVIFLRDLGNRRSIGTGRSRSRRGRTAVSNAVRMTTRSLLANAIGAGPRRSLRIEQRHGSSSHGSQSSHGQSQQSSGTIYVGNSSPSSDIEVIEIFPGYNSHLRRTTGLRSSARSSGGNRSRRSRSIELLELDATD